MLKALLTFISGVASSFFSVGLAMHGAPMAWALYALGAGALLMFGAMFIVARS